MISDQTRFLGSKAYTADAYSNDEVNMGANKDWGAGEELCLVGYVTVAFAGNTACVVSFRAGAATAPTTVIAQTRDLGAAAAINARKDPIILPIPPGVTWQYGRAYVDITGTTTAGTIDFYVVPRFSIPAGLDNNKNV